MVSLVLPAFDSSGSLGSLPRQVVYPPGSMVPPWVTDSRFLSGNNEAELKPTTSLPSYFSVVSYLSSSLEAPAIYIPLSAACWGYSIIIIIISNICIYPLR